MSTILITGGAGFIGSHTCSVLIEAGHDLIIFDSFINSSSLALQRVKEINGLNHKKDDSRLRIVEGDIRDKEALQKVFTKSSKENKPVEAVIHFAGLKSVSDSVQQPLDYWDVNVNGSGVLFSTMQANNCRTLVFSSSATIYGAQETSPITEDNTIQPINPYGNTKAAVEKMLLDIYQMNDNWRIASLRYFNPVGAHPSGCIGESPTGVANNLFPIVTQVAIGRRKILQIFGNNWPTPDNTCVRDYIHVMDLAEGHLAALNYLANTKSELLTLNLGSGKGYSVLQVVNAFEKATDQKINYEIVDARPGDVAETVADPSKATRVLGWETRRTILEMCFDSWKWQRNNPKGYCKEI